MALDTYRAKRDFKRTAEPKGRVASKQRGRLYLIQEHAARRLHYDLRLELDGVLKSWAVTRGPSLDPAQKRLAVHVEDHPIDYGSFEGTIPKGEYGGGTVVLWDTGQWTPIGDARKAYAKGHLEFSLEGEKLRGRWHLVRMARRAGETEKHDNWLLMKAEDAEARPGDDARILDEWPNSVKTGRTLAQVAEGDPAPEAATPAKPSKTAPRPKPTSIRPSPTKGAPVKGAVAGPLPETLEPCLATLVDKAPKGRRWIHEIKYDGYRVLARIDDGRVTLLTRTGLDWTHRFGPELREALEAVPVKQALIDGEIVVEGPSGSSNFSDLQADLSSGRTDRFRYYAFDLLHLDGFDLRPCSLDERRRALEAFLPPAGDRVLRSETFTEDGDLILKHACRLSLEGLVSKLRDKPYRSGRGKDWVKSKCAQRQEFVIGGFMPSSTGRNAVGALLLGVYEGGTLMHVGRVGTGFTAAVAADLFRRLDPLRVKKSPFGATLTADERRQAAFVKPDLVAEVEFRSWTGDHHLRHASFRGLREDKAAAEVIQETPAPGPDAVQPRRAVAATLTHPDRLYWPESGVTKEGLATYYADVWRFMAPFVVNRPLSLVRCPGGIVEACFFQKHVWRGAGKALRQKADPADPDGEKLLVIDDLDGMIALVQAGALEIHPWGSTFAAVEKPDMIILDLDPSPEVAWTDVIAAAHEVRDRLDAFGLASFVKTSGGKGLHVVAPLKPDADWATAKAFTKTLAEAMTADSPERFVATVTKAKRKNKILIDYLRNGRGATAVAPFSSRSRPGAPVSMPLEWSELGDGLGPAHFTVLNTASRLAHLTADPWGNFQKAARPLPAVKPIRSAAGKR